jgi:ribose transport system substrate-binding protein
MASRTLALFLRALDNQYQNLQKSEFYARAHLRGFSVVEYDANNDAGAQLQQLRECLRAGDGARPRALLVNPVRESLLPDVAREAVRSGMPWVSLNRTPDYVTDLRREYPKVPVFCVDPDQRQVGYFQGRQFLTLLPTGGELLYVHGPLSASSARLRLAGARAEITGSPLRITVAGGNWSEESGFQATMSWLRSAIDRNWGACVVGAQNDTMGLGAHRALQEMATAKNRPEIMKVRIAGCDGAPNYGQRFVAEKVLSATVVIPLTTGRAIDELASALDGGKAVVADVSLEVASFPQLDELSPSFQHETGSRPPT